MALCLLIKNNGQQCNYPQETKNLIIRHPWSNTSPQPEQVNIQSIITQWSGCIADMHAHAAPPLSGMQQS